MYILNNKRLMKIQIKEYAIHLKSLFITCVSQLLKSDKAEV